MHTGVPEFSRGEIHVDNGDETDDDGPEGDAGGDDHHADLDLSGVEIGDDDPPVSYRPPGFLVAVVLGRFAELEHGNSAFLPLHCVDPGKQAKDLSRKSQREAAKTLADRERREGFDPTKSGVRGVSAADENLAAQEAQQLRIRQQENQIVALDTRGKLLTTMMQQSFQIVESTSKLFDDRFRSEAAEKMKSYMHEIDIISGQLLVLQTDIARGNSTRSCVAEALQKPNTMILGQAIAENETRPTKVTRLSTSQVATFAPSDHVACASTRRSLTTAELDEVRAACDVSEESQRVVASFPGGVGGSTVHLLDRHFSRHKDGWLFDETLNALMHYLGERDRMLCQADPTRSPCLFFSTFFMEKVRT